MGRARSHAALVANQGQENAKMEMIVPERWLKLSNASHVNARSGQIGQNFHLAAPHVVAEKK